jgi:D-lactate dehydrogenase (cytochrome)
MRADPIVPLSGEHEDYLHDESRSTGFADSISFPTTEADVIEVVSAIRAQRGSITIQGARTGITGGAVPNGGHILSLQRMAAIGGIERDSPAGTATITVQPGALLQDIYHVVESEGLLFPPDPTEASASVGGAIACNASGAMSHYYGPTRRWIRSIRLVLSDGSVLAIARGEHHAQGRAFSLTTDSGRTISGQLPSYRQPPVKNAAGYYVADDMDLIDLFIGMEGTLGIVTEAKLCLIPRPAAVLGLTAFLPSEEAALQFVGALRDDVAASIGSTQLVAIEYFDRDALKLLRRMKAEQPAFEKVPALRPHFETAIYAEFHGEDAEMAEEAMLQVLDPLAAVGGSDEDTWVGITPRDLEPLRAFRHAVPEAVNLLVAQRKRDVPGLTKVGTDMSVPDAQLGPAMAMYRSALADAGLESVVFGHISDNHVHVNVLPHDLDDYERARAIYHAWAEQVVAWGGSVSAEHGIGKLKVALLRLMYGDSGIAQMREVRARFDPDGLLNPGNMFTS